jgi:hypothetical protein
LAVVNLLCFGGFAEILQTAGQGTAREKKYKKTLSFSADSFYVIKPADLGIPR